MRSVYNFIASNAIASTIAATALLSAIAWIAKNRRDQRDSERIYNFLQQSRYSTDFEYRSTEAIASHVNLPEDRVAALCACHPKIRRNEKKIQSWKLTE